MSGPENTFIASVHRHLPVGLYKMKNHNQYNGGIADVWYSGKKDLWVEYKFIKVPIRDSTVIDFGLSHLQKEWLTQRHIEGRNVGVLVGCKAGGAWLPGITWDRPINAEFFRRITQTRPELGKLLVTLTG